MTNKSNILPIASIIIGFLIIIGMILYSNANACGDYEPYELEEIGYEIVEKSGGEKNLDILLLIIETETGLDKKTSTHDCITDALEKSNRLLITGTWSSGVGGPAKVQTIEHAMNN